jgi:N-acetylglucosamine kinase-like BadF-type ATPase
VAFFLGIDGGGSKTICRLGDDTSVLASGSGSGSNIVRLGEAAARASLTEAIRQACCAAGISPEQISRTCIGIAGGARPLVRNAIWKILSETIAGEIEIVGDMVIALEGAFGSAPGVIAVAGTGSIAYGRNPHGETARAGGWGFAISDEGSGHWIGRAATAAAMHNYDEGKSTGLLERIMEVWRVDSREHLVLAANAVPPPDFAALFPAVLAASDSGDPTACQILEEAGKELGGLAKTVIRRLFQDGQKVNVAMAGAVLANGKIVSEAFRKNLTSQHAEAQVAGEVIEPVQGALALARRITL